MMSAKCALIVLQLNRYLGFRDKKTKLKICRQTFTLSTQLQDRSYIIRMSWMGQKRQRNVQEEETLRANVLALIVKCAKYAD